MSNVGPEMLRSPFAPPGVRRPHAEPGARPATLHVTDERQGPTFAWADFKAGAAAGTELDFPNDNVANGPELAAADVTFPTE